MHSKANEMLRDILDKYDVTAQQFRDTQESCDFQYLHDQIGDIAVFRIDTGATSGRDIFVERFGCRGDTAEWDYVSPAELYTLSNAQKAFVEYKVNEWMYDIEPEMPWKFWDDQDFLRIA